jgi:hypothetical protein
MAAMALKFFNAVSLLLPGLFRKRVLFLGKLNAGEIRGADGSVCGTVKKESIQFRPVDRLNFSHKL